MDGRDVRFKRLLPYRLVGLLLLATVGAYVATALAMSALALALTRSGVSTRADAVMLSSLMSFAVYAGLILRIFAVASAKRAWLESVSVLAALAMLWLALGGRP